MADAGVVDRAEEFLWRNARLIDRLRFSYLFRGGDRELPIAAVRAYQNSDGGFGHSWLDTATEFCWRELDDLTSTWAYEARSCIPFLDHVPDRARAEAVFERVGKLVLEVVEFDTDAEGEVHRPLDFAPRPDTIARRLFSDEVISEHLDALLAAQRDDGGWTFDWQIWTPNTEPEWRGWVTVRALKTLRAYDRL